jgi:hypothetical protein
VRWLALAVALLAAPALAQEKKAPPKKKNPAPAAKAHAKATPEQIRRFHDLQKKQAK